LSCDDDQYTNLAPIRYSAVRMHSGWPLIVTVRLQQPSSAPEILILAPDSCLRARETKHHSTIRRGIECRQAYECIDDVTWRMYRLHLHSLMYFSISFTSPHCHIAISPVFTTPLVYSHVELLHNCDFLSHGTLRHNKRMFVQINSLVICSHNYKILVSQYTTINVIIWRMFATPFSCHAYYFFVFFHHVGFINRCLHA